MNLREISYNQTRDCEEFINHVLDSCDNKTLTYNELIGIVGARILGEAIFLSAMFQQEEGIEIPPLNMVHEALKTVHELTNIDIEK